MARSKDGLFQRGRIWWFWFRGKRVSSRTSDRPAARLYKARLERAAADPAYLAANETTLGDAVMNFMVEFKTRARSPLTLRMHRRCAGHLARLIGGDTRMADVSARSVDSFIASRLEEGASRVTIGKELTTLRQVLGLARRHGSFPFEVDKVMPLAFSLEYKARERALSPSEVMALVVALEEHSPLHARMVAFFVATGARKSEAEAAQPGDVDWERGVVRIRGTKTRDAAAEVPILPTFAGLLHYAEPARFGTWTNMTRDLAAACKRAGIPRATANDLRRTTGTLLRMAGASTDMIARVLRHADSRMVERVYGRIAAEAAGRVVTVQIQHSGAEFSDDPGVQGRNRTSDTRIFNPNGLPTDTTAPSENQQVSGSHASHGVATGAGVPSRNRTADRYFRALAWGWFRRAA